MDRYIEKYPEKKMVRGISSKLGGTPCGMHYHHWSYNIEHKLSVILLTRADHFTLHRFIRYDQGCKMYRTLSGELLNTIEKHQEYYESVMRLEKLQKAS